MDNLATAHVRGNHELLCKQVHLLYCIIAYIVVLFLKSFVHVIEVPD